MIKYGLLLLLFLSCERSKNDIYLAMFDNKTESVTVSHAQDQAFLDCCIWLHFTIEKNDLLPLLDSCTKEAVDLDNWRSVNPPEWWSPQSLAGEVTYYTQSSNNGRRSRNFYVNESFTEVFYVDRAGH